MRVITVILIGFFVLISCYKIEDDFFIYTIKKGNHSSGNHVSIHNSRRLECEVVFTESCIYEIPNDTEFDTNKLIGISDSYSHSTHSVRVGWRYYKGQLEILSYVRKNKVIHLQHMCYVEINQPYFFSVEIKNDRYILICKKSGGEYKPVKVEVSRTSNYNGIRYKLFPYFGGNNPAPHDITIKIKYL